MTTDVTSINHTRTDRTHPHDYREDETFFRLNYPRSVDSIRVVEVVRFVPGGVGAYASAWVVGYRGETVEPYSVHLLVMMDDDVLAGKLRWFCVSGVYDFSSLNVARYRASRVM